MNCDIFIPVRLSSTRLPKKALLEIYNTPILQILIERLSKSKKIRNIVVCTTTSNSDDELIYFLQKNNIKYFRGSEKDILKRYLDAATAYHTDFIINVDGDDIYTDHDTIDQIVKKYLESKNDFIKIINVPLGLQSFGFSLNILKEICKNKMTNDTETGWIRFLTELKFISKGEVSPNLQEKFPENIRLSLDYKEDFEIAKEIFSTLGNDFDLESLSKFLKKNTKILDLIKKTENKWKMHWNTNLSDITMRANEEN